MPLHDPVKFSLPRFLWRALLWSAIGGFLWKATVRWNADLTIWLAKALQSLAGFPAPYMFCDERPLFWHATLFPPIMGLALASYWLRWPQRFVRMFVGYFVYAVLTAITIVLHESPYLPDSRFRESATSALVNANYLMFGLVIWVLAAGPWYVKRALSTGSADKSGLLTRAWRFVRYGWLTRLTMLTVGVAAAIPLFAASTSKQRFASRRDIARAMCEVPFFPSPSTADVNVSPDVQKERDRLNAEAIRVIEKVIAEESKKGPPDLALSLLCGHLYLSMRPSSEDVLKQYRVYGTKYIKDARQGRFVY